MNDDQQRRLYDGIHEVIAESGNRISLAYDTNVIVAQMSNSAAS